MRRKPKGLTIGVLDCKEAIDILEDREGRTLTAVESARLSHHVSDCPSCRELAGESPPADREWVWLMKVPEEALDDGGIAELPTVDPSVYELGGTIARGGMGRIIKARDRRLGREVAVKQVLSAGYRERFEREALITARLQHPAIVPIYEAGLWPDGSAFYTMRLVSGATLADAIEGSSSLEERLGYASHVVAVTDAIAFAHSKQVIHRDLKPLNILVGEFGETVVIDWGLARIVGEAEPEDGEEKSADASDELVRTDLTQTGAVLGTPAYMSPEQALGVPADERTDVYALGAILYTLLVGKAPFKDTHDGVIAGVLIDAVINKKPTPIDKLEPRAPRDLIAIAERAMATKPDDRYKDAKEMATELHRFQAGQLLSGREYSSRELFFRWLARHRAAVTVAAVFMAVLIFGGAFSVWRIAASRNSERAARVTAEAAQAEAQARNADLIFRQAQSALDDDPTEALAWLRGYPKDGPKSTGAALLAKEAERRGVASRIFVAPTSEPGRLVFAPKGDTLVLTSEGGVARAWNPHSGLERDLFNSQRPEIFVDAQNHRFLLPVAKKAQVVAEHFAGPARSTATYADASGGTEWPVAFDPKSGQMAMMLADDTIGLWSFGADSVRETGVAGEPIAFAQDGATLVTTDTVQEFLNLYDVSTMELLERIPLDRAANLEAKAFAIRPGPEFMLAMRPYLINRRGDGIRIYRRGGKGIERLFNILTGTAVAFSPAGDKLAAGFSGGMIAIADADTLAIKCRWSPGRNPVAIAYHDGATSGGVLAIGLGNGSVVVASECGEIEDVFWGHELAVRAVAVSADGKLVASASKDQQVRVYKRREAKSKAAVTKRELTGCTELLDVRRRGDWTWQFCSEPEPSRWIGYRHSDATTHIGDDGISALFSRDGSTYARGQKGTTVGFRNGSRFELPFEVFKEFGLSADGSRIFNPTKNGLEVWNIDSKKRETTIDLVTAFVRPSPDGEVLFVDNARGAAIIDMNGDVEVQSSVHQYYTPNSAWSENSRVVAMPTSDTALSVYDRDEKKWHQLSVTTDLARIAVSPDGQLVAVATTKRLVLFDLATGVRLRVEAPRADLVEEIAFETGAVIFYRPGLDMRVTLPRFDVEAIDALTDVVIENGRAVSRSN